MRKAEIIGIIILSAATFQIIGTANANPQDSLMDKLDLDKDGFITLKEATSNPMLLKSFGSIDTNEDGRLSLEEIHLSKLDVTTLNSATEKKSDTEKDDKVSE